MARKERKKISLDPRNVFFGWWMSLAGGILCLWGYAYHAYGFSALFKPISEELGISRFATSIAASITRFEGGIEAPLVGYLADRFGPKILVLIGVFLVGLGLVLMNFINSVWTFYLVWSVICSTGINISLGMPLGVAITNWFIRKRGTAMSIRQVFSGLSGVIGLPIVAWLIANYGWRTACLVGGLIMWSGGLPLAWFFIKSRRPEHYGLLPDGGVIEAEKIEDAERAANEYAAEAGEIDFTTRQAIRTKAFWLMIAAYSLHAALYPVMNIHCIPFLTDRGMDPMTAAATMSLFVTASIPARFLGGVVVDRVKTNHIRLLMGGAYLMQCIGVTLFLFNQQSMAMLYTFFILYGFGMGASMPMAMVMRARYFGRKNFGTIAGISQGMIMPVSIMGPIAGGLIYDMTGSYILAFVLFAITLGISSVVMASIKPPKPPREMDLPSPA
ncbi:MAG: MFS transporter [Deltaproteobacteria bacterium]|nr:MFS transporter [Deltaproteobacteria bacterium]